MIIESIEWDEFVEANKYETKTYVEIIGTMRENIQNKKEKDLGIRVNLSINTLWAKPTNSNTPPQVGT